MDFYGVAKRGMLVVLTVSTRLGRSLLSVSVFGVIVMSMFGDRYTVPVHHVIRNVVMLGIASFLSESATPQSYWIGLGLRTVTDEQVEQLLAQQFSFEDTQGCDEMDQLVVDQLSNVSGWIHQDEPSDSVLGRILARIHECNGDIPQALDILANTEDQHIRDIWRAGIFYRNGFMKEAYETIVAYTCTNLGRWCSDYLQASLMTGGRPPSLGDRYNSFTNIAEERSPALSILAAHRLEIVSASNLTVTAPPAIVKEFGPVMVLGVATSSDNYLQGASQPISGSSVMLLIRGEVIGASGITCVQPRLTFYSAENYMSDSALTYQVTGKFEVKYWASAPPSSDTVVPRISFDEECLIDNQQIVIYEIELAFAP